MRFLGKLAKNSLRRTQSGSEGFVLWNSDFYISISSPERVYERRRIVSNPKNWLRWAQSVLRVFVGPACCRQGCLRRARNMVKVLLFVENKPDESGFWFLNKKRFVLRF